MAPLGLQLNQVLAINQSFEFKEPMAATWSFDHSAIYRSLHLRLVIANNLSLVKGGHKDRSESCSNATRYQFNS
jgi:hypothetical protein